MKEINRKMIDQAFNEFKDFKFKNKIVYCVIYETFGKKKGFEICDGELQLRHKFQAERGEVVIDKQHLKDITNSFKVNIDPYYKSLFQLTSFEEALKGRYSTCISGTENLPSYMIKKLTVIYKKR